MKEIIKTIFDIKEDSWLFFFPIIAFYMMGKVSPNVIIINNLKSLILFNIAWLFCSMGLYVIFRALIIIIESIENLLAKKRN